MLNKENPILDIFLSKIKTFFLKLLLSKSFRLYGFFSILVAMKNNINKKYTTITFSI